LPRPDVEILEPGPEIEQGLALLERDMPNIRSDYERFLEYVVGHVGHGNRFISGDGTFHEDKRWAYVQSSDPPYFENAAVLVFTVQQAVDKWWEVKPLLISLGARWNDEGEAQAKNRLGIP